MKKISVCLIVKNEQLVLKRCLKCVSKIADELIIVDTGSTDKTIQIAKKWTKNVYFYKWDNNFSNARNFALSKATCEYVMWIDADDTISSQNIKLINSLKTNLNADTYMLKYIISFDEKNKPAFEFYRERIIKNCSKCKFIGFIHEAIQPFGKIKYLNISIEHHQLLQTKDKKRNLKIYRYHLKNHEKFNARDLFYYSRELYYNNYISKTIISLKKYLKMKNKFLANIIDAHLILSDCFLRKGDLYNSKIFLLKSMEYDIPNALICCKIAYIYVLEHSYEKAIFWYKNALNSKKNPENGSFIQNDYYDFIPLVQISYLSYLLKNYDDFKKYHFLAKKIKPYSKTIINNEKFINN